METRKPILTPTSDPPSPYRRPPSATDLRMAQAYEDLDRCNEFFVQMIGLFVSTIGEEWANLNVACKVGDREEIRRRAHSLKGSVSIWTSGPLDEAIHVLHAHALTDEWERIPEAMRRIPPAWNDFWQTLEDFVEVHCPEQRGRISWRQFENFLQSPSPRGPEDHLLAEGPHEDLRSKRS